MKSSGSEPYAEQLQTEHALNSARTKPTHTAPSTCARPERRGKGDAAGPAAGARGRGGRREATARSARGAESHAGIDEPDCARAEPAEAVVGAPEEAYGRGGRRAEEARGRANRPVVKLPGGFWAAQLGWWRLGWPLPELGRCAE
jgi:hypothetical protein